MHTRKLGRQDKDHSASVVLAPKGRRAKFRGRPLVASIGTGYSEDNMFGGTYRKPELRFRILDTDGETSLCGPNIEMHFQTHRVGSTDTGLNYDKPGPRGFLKAAKGPWVGAYGGTLKGNFHYSGDGKEIVRIIQLVDRAREATRGMYDTKFRGCDLLRLIIGLQLCGVEVRIWNESVDVARTQRRAPEPAELAA